MFRYLPEQGSEVAPNIDWIHNIVLDLSLFFTVLIVGAMIYFVIRYRERDGKTHETPRIEGSNLLEFLWTAVPTIICVFVAYYGVIYYRQLRHIPEDALTIQVRGQKWKWDFEYDNGKSTTGEFVVPVNTPIKLVLRSRDVLHSFFLPTMRVKSDALPSMYTYVSFTPVKTGLHQAFCTEYCGDNHSQMLARMKVVSQDEYTRWVNDRSAERLQELMTPAERGRVLYQQKGCVTCHSLNGARVVGPSFLKLYQREEKMTDGTVIKSDDNYITESILNPNAKVVEGYPPAMPSFQGQLNETDISNLIAFIKTIDGTNPEAAAPAAAADTGVDLATMTPAERGKLWYESKLCISCHSLDGSKLVGPSFKGIWGREEKMVGGATVVSDEAYITESIKNPTAKVVEGYPPAMPAGLLDDAQIKDVIEFLKTVK